MANEVLSLTDEEAALRLQRAYAILLELSEQESSDVADHVASQLAEVMNEDTARQGRES